MKELLNYFFVIILQFLHILLSFRNISTKKTKESMQSAILDIHEYACLHHNRGHEISFESQVIVSM